MMRGCSDQWAVKETLRKATYGSITTRTPEVMRFAEGVTDYIYGVRSPVYLEPYPTDFETFKRIWNGLPDGKF